MADPTEFLSRTGFRQVQAATTPASAITGDTLAANVLYSSLTSLGTIATGVWQGTVIGVAYGGTGANLSATGGASNVVQQASAGAAFTVGQLGASDLSNGITGTGAVVLEGSPALTGTPTAPTQPPGDNSTNIATTAYADALVSAGISTTITTAALTGGGTQGSMTFVNGILTAETSAT